MSSELESGNKPTATKSFDDNNTHTRRNSIEAQISPQDAHGSAVQDENKPNNTNPCGRHSKDLATSEDASATSTKPTKKRGRLNKEHTREGIAGKRKKNKPSTDQLDLVHPPTQSNQLDVDSTEILEKKDSCEIEGETRSRGKPKRAAPAATAGGWTEEQDAYLKQLYQKTKAIKHIHEDFEAKFKTGKSLASLQLRYGKLKRDSIVLSRHEEDVLKRAINTVENNKAAAVLELYLKDGGERVTKLTQTFVAMQLKKWGGASK
ncbi:hypothetical protein TWF730_007045 [Orbilia blumenaviensis]|uniref:Myb-like domain-containing protein n=1 Tax=Orbilia blumenaviensis TaxID=1796055 RepID=A0AAV9VG30_9PEZI